VHELCVDLGFSGEPVFDFVAGGEPALLRPEKGCLGDQRRTLFGTYKLSEGRCDRARRSSLLAGCALARSLGGGTFLTWHGRNSPWFGWISCKISYLRDYQRRKSWLRGDLSIRASINFIDARTRDIE